MMHDAVRTATKIIIFFAYLFFCCYTFPTNAGGVAASTTATHCINLHKVCVLEGVLRGGETPETIEQINTR